MESTIRASTEQCSASTYPCLVLSSSRLQGASFPPPDKADIVGYDAEKYLAVWRQLETAVDAGAFCRRRAAPMPARFGHRVAALMGRT